jgi:hypothetical protein
MSQPTQSTISPVAAFLSFGGAMIPCVWAWVLKTSMRRGDEFQCTFPMRAPGAASVLSGTADSNKASIIYSVAGASKPLLDGIVDQIELDLPKELVLVRGRDKGVVLTEKRLTEQYKNKKASDIVKDIAERAKLNPVIVESKEDAGKTYDEDTVHLILGKTFAEALTWLAEREGYRWYVVGDRLHFEPKDTSSASVYQLVYRPSSPLVYARANFLRLRIARNFPASRPTIVEIFSWHHKKARLFKGIAAANGDGDDLTYQHYFPGMTQEQVDAIAGSHLADYIRHECTFNAELVNEIDIDVDQKLGISGAGPLFDGTYDIDSIEYYYEAGESAEILTNVCAKGTRRERLAD